jgi:hypothetical protein
MFLGVGPMISYLNFLLVLHVLNPVILLQILEVDATCSCSVGADTLVKMNFLISK